MSLVSTPRQRLRLEGRRGELFRLFRVPARWMQPIPPGVIQSSVCPDRISKGFFAVDLGWQRICKRGNSLVAGGRRPFAPPGLSAVGRALLGFSVPTALTPKRALLGVILRLPKLQLARDS